MRAPVRMLLSLAATAALFAFAGCQQKPAEDLHGSDARAVAIANSVMDALGGQKQWAALRGLRWTFGVQVGDSIRASRRHAWDKVTGQHRVDGVNRQGQTFTIIHTVGDTTAGMAWVDGTEIVGDSLHKLIKRADALWVNDSYWFLMPYKLRDPGVTLGYAGDTTMAGATYDKLALSFAQVGLTPGDHYWVYVDRADHRVKHWEMVLQGDTPPPVGYTWGGWEQHDGLWFPTEHRRDSTNVFTNKVETVASFPATEFEKP